MGFDFQRKRLSNGILVLHEKRKLPVVSFSICNKFGGAYEIKGIKGIAHFIEHLVFTGTKNRSYSEISGDIEKKGGVLNAFTAQDVTSFWFKLPSEHLFLGMEIIVDILKNSIFPVEKFEKEKKVVLEEIKMYHDDPQRDVFNKIESNLYKEPFGMGVIGNKDTVSNLSKKFVKDFFDKNYFSENYFVVVVGDANFDRICEFLEDNFKSRTKKNDNPRIKIIKKHSISFEERPGIDQAHFIWGTHAPVSGYDKYVLEVLDGYLGSGMSSKLFLEIREKRGLVYTIKSSINSEKSYSYYSIYAGTTKESVKKIEKLILKCFLDTSKDLTEKHLQEIKQRLIGLRKVSSEESVDVMNGLIFSEISTGNASEFYKYVDKINDVKLKDVKKMAKELVKKYSTASIVPR